MIRWPLSDDKLAELLQLVVELEIAREEGDRVSVDFNARVRVPGVSRPREVDILVRYRVGGREFVRLVEVQKRTRKIGQQFVDQVLGKMKQLDADKATLVAAAGFTADALARIKASRGRLEAIRITKPRLGAWEVSETCRVDLRVDGGIHDATVQAAAVVERIGTAEAMLVLSGIADELRLAVFMLVPRPNSGRPRDVRLWVLGATGGSAVTKAAISFALPDGTQGTAVSAPTRELLVPIGGS